LRPEPHAIVQCRGKQNRLPTPADLDVVKKWARFAGLTLSPCVRRRCGNRAQAPHFQFLLSHERKCPNFRQRRSSAGQAAGGEAVLIPKYASR
jgi:hypothetical protein